MPPLLRDDWSTPWLNLLPPDTRFELRGAPSSLVDGLRDRVSTGGNTLLGWRVRPSDLTPTLGYRGLALFDPIMISPAWLRDQGFAHLRHLSVVPSLHNPRWLLPWDARRAAARGWDLYNPQSTRGRVAKATARWITRSFGASTLGRELLIAHRSCPPLDETLIRTLGTTDYELSLAPRWPGARRRLGPLLATPQGRELLFLKHRISMQATTPAGEVLAYIKFATRSGAIQAIEHEARFTSYVSGLHLEAAVVPKVLHHGPDNGGYLAISAPLACGSRASETVLTQRHLKLLAEFARHTGPQRTSTLLEDVSRRMDACHNLLDQHWHDLFTRGTAALRGISSLADLPTSLAHGDFAPWNLRLDFNSGRLAVFDWERAQRGQFLLYDCFHFQIQTNTLLHHLGGRTNVIRTLGSTLDSPLVQALGLARPQVAALLVAYLLDSSLRWFEDHRALPDLQALAESTYQAMRGAMLRHALEELGACQS